MLDEVVERAYDVFSKYAVNVPLDVCTVCCLTAEEELRLARTPVRGIPVELLADYTDSARPEKTRIDEVKHFLPRYLELVSQFVFPTHSAELSFSRLSPFSKDEWSEEEQDVLCSFAIEFFTRCLATYPLPEGIDTILIMLDKGGFAIEPLLDIWKTTNGLMSTLNFTDLYVEGFDFTKSRLTNAFDEDGKVSEVLAAWFDDDQVKAIFRERIENAVMGDIVHDEKSIVKLSFFYEMMSPR